jgi:hypothetical protein
LDPFDGAENVGIVVRPGSAVRVAFQRLPLIAELESVGWILIHKDPMRGERAALELFFRDVAILAMYSGQTGVRGDVREDRRQIVVLVLDVEKQ